MTDEFKQRIKSIRKLFAINILKNILWYVAFFVFTRYVGVICNNNYVHDTELLSMYTYCTAWIVFLGLNREVADLYDIMKKDTQVILDSIKGTENNEK